jgi:tRNA A-37 threonylcarbamoyl transferase component Bud32
MLPPPPSIGIASAQWSAAFLRSDRLVPLNNDEQLMWLKKSAPGHAKYRYWLLDTVSSLLKLPLLRAVPKPGGAKSIAIEYKRLKTLAGKGILVPQVMAHDNDWLLLSDIGVTADSYFRRNSADIDKRSEAIVAILSELARLHRKNEYLSQGFARNIIFQDGASKTIGFIDFEDDPLDVLPLELAQARDFLLLAFSTSFYFAGHEQRYRAYINDHLQTYPSPYRHEIMRTIRKFRRIKELLARMRIAGGDYRKLASTVDILS